MTEAEGSRELVGEFSLLEAEDHLSEQLIITVPYNGTVRAVSCVPAQRFPLFLEGLEEDPMAPQLGRLEVRLEISVIKIRPEPDADTAVTRWELTHSFPDPDSIAPLEVWGMFVDFRVIPVWGMPGGRETRLILAKDRDILDLREGDELYWRVIRLGRWDNIKFSVPGGIVKATLE